MNRADLPQPIKDLVLNLKQLPGVGPRSAERVALWLHREGPGFSESLAEALTQVQRDVGTCEHCGFFSTSKGCALCSDETRDPEALCVVEQAIDVIALDKTGTYRGQYHVLGGKLSPLRHVGPEDLTLDQLDTRLRGDRVHEVILALSNDVEGEATANFLADRLTGNATTRTLTLTRLAQGLPAGGGLDHADELTLSRALSGRTRMGHA